MINDFCKPRVVWAKTSTPTWVVPNQCDHDGPFNKLEKSFSL